MWKRIKIETYGDFFENPPIDSAIEKTLLGTEGALLHSLSQLQSPDHPFSTLNTDTLLLIPIVDFHLSADGQVTTLGDTSSKLIIGIPEDYLLFIQNFVEN
ncbi:hypothetical protein [Simkania sp.]|uniref:hypothetical protein n=1 Tax=Simkania sp. TaxID=34094 RepID=UPI003B52E7C1